MNEKKHGYAPAFRSVPLLSSAVVTMFSQMQIFSHVTRHSFQRPPPTENDYENGL
jgi:hypothetical protein